MCHIQHRRSFQYSRLGVSSAVIRHGVGDAGAATGLPYESTDSSVVHSCQWRPSTGGPEPSAAAPRAAAVLVDVHPGGVEARRLAALARRRLAHAAVAPRQRQRRERLRRRLRVELRLLLLLLRQPLLLNLLQLLQLRELVLLRLLLLERSRA